MDEMKISRLAMAYQTLFYADDGKTLKPEAEIVLVDLVVKHGRFTQTTVRSDGVDALQRNEGKREIAEHVFGMLRLNIWQLFDLAKREREIVDSMDEG